MNNNNKISKKVANVILAGVNIVTGTISLVACYPNLLDDHNDIAFAENPYKGIASSTHYVIGNCGDPELSKYNRYEFRAAEVRESPTGTLVDISGVVSRKKDSNNIAFITLTFNISGNMLAEYEKALNNREKNDGNFNLIKANFLNSIANSIKYKTPKSINFVEIDGSINENRILNSIVRKSKDDHYNNVRWQDIISIGNFAVEDAECDKDNGNKVSFDLSSVFAYRVEKRIKKRKYCYNDFAYHTYRVSLDVGDKEFEMIANDPSNMVKICMSNIQYNNPMDYSVRRVKYVKLSGSSLDVYPSYNINANRDPDIVSGRYNAGTYYGNNSYDNYSGGGMSN